ncbi:MAG: helix-turn-helix domain-containing protein [Gemmataceae bacterium]
MNNPALLTLAEAAAFLAISRATLYRLRDAGRFPMPVGIPGTAAQRWRRTDLEKYVENLKPRRPKGK